MAFVTGVSPIHPRLSMYSTSLVQNLPFICVVYPGPLALAKARRYRCTRV